MQAIWAYALPLEKIYPSLVKNGVITAEFAKSFAGHLTQDLKLFDVPGAHLPYICEELIRPYDHERLAKNISLTDLARQKTQKMPSYVIQSWLRDYETIEFLRLWERQSNPEFDDTACNKIIQLMKKTTFTLTPKQWITKTNAIGLISKQGKGGGTLAHSDIAVEFHMWIDPKFKMDVVKKYRDSVHMEGIGHDIK